MNILVTGSAGFIGFSICEKLLKINKIKKIFGIDNLNNYYSSKLKLKRTSILLGNKKFLFKKIDLIDNFSLNKFFKDHKIDVVINMAAQAGVRYSYDNPKSYIYSNIKGFQNLLECLEKFKIKKCIFASSSSVFGDSKKYPLKETMNLNPKNIYSLSKQNNEILAKIYSNFIKTQFIGLRFFTIYGEWGRPDMFILKYIMSSVKKKNFELYNYGNHYRDFTYINDAVGLVEKILFKKFNKNFLIFNICSSRPIKILKIIKEINKYVLPPKIIMKPLQKADVYKTHGSNKKIISFFKSFKFTPYKIGISKTLNWFFENKKFLLKF
jgi:UDP-glucuronate 4-epimerase